MAVFSWLKGRFLFQALGAPIRVGNKSTTVASGSLVITRLFLINFLAKHENWIINKIKPDLFFSAAETKRDKLKGGALLHAGCWRTTSA